MQPIRQNVLVKPYESSGITEGGLIVPDSIKPISNKVLVVSVGNGSPKKPMLLKKGDTGYRVKGWGEEIIINDEKHYMMTQDSIIALQ